MTLFRYQCACGHQFFRIRMACHTEPSIETCPACGREDAAEQLVIPQDGSDPVAACHHDDGHECTGSCGS